MGRAAASSTPVMYSLLFERPIAELVCWTVIEFALVCLWSWRRTKPTGQAAILGLIALPLLLGLSYVVVTAGERVAAVCEAIAEAVDDGDIKAISAAVAPEFEVGGLDRDAFLGRVERTLSRFRVDHPRLSRVDVEAAGDSAVATLNATCRIRSEELTIDSLPTRWRVTFRRIGEAWRVVSVEAIPVPPLNLKRPEDWLR